MTIVTTDLDLCDPCAPRMLQACIDNPMTLRLYKFRPLIPHNLMTPIPL